MICLICGERFTYHGDTWRPNSTATGQAPEGWTLTLADLRHHLWEGDGVLLVPTYPSRIHLGDFSLCTEHVVTVN